MFKTEEEVDVFVGNISKRPREQEVDKKFVRTGHGEEILL